MTAETLTERARAWEVPRSHGARWMGHPLAYLATATVLLAAFGWTFFAHPDRVAPTKDPAYYTWRTEMLLEEKPVRLIEIEGAFSMFAGGYRVAAPVIGGFLRQIAGVSPLKTTIFLMVGLPVGIALLLGAFAFRARSDPLAFHSVALGSGSLLLTPPFVGYLDNMLCLFFLAGALLFMPETARSWPARFGFGMFLLLAGLTHPTTLAIFCVVLGLMAGVRLVFRRFDLPSVVRDDGPMLATAFAAALFTYLIWKGGIFGRPASLSEAALPPPYGSSFFVDRLVLWVKAMNPLVNGPVFLLGLVGLVATGIRRGLPGAEAVPSARARFLGAEDDLTRVAIVWLAPLAGVFGFLGGLTYPYYRFFNTTLAWVLLVGFGLYLLVSAALARGPAVGSVAIAVALGVIGFNFASGFDVSGWNRAEGGWISATQREDLGALRHALSEEVDPDAPVVFVIDDADRDFQIWGFTKLSGNTSRVALPEGQIDRGHLYLGELDNLAPPGSEPVIDGRPTLVGEETYDRLSPALLEEAQDAVRAASRPPVVVLASAFNAPAFEGGPPEADATRRIWVVDDGVVDTGDGTVRAPEGDSPGPLGWLRIVAGLALLLLPGIVATAFFLPNSRWTEVLALGPALSVGLVALIGILALAVARTPLNAGLAWGVLVVTLIWSVLLRRRAGRALGPPTERVIYGP